MPNITGGDGNFTLKVQNTQQVGMVVFFAALNILFSITTILGNVLILIAHMSDVDLQESNFCRCFNSYAVVMALEQNSEKERKIM